MSAAIECPTHEPLALNLGELLDAISDVVSDEDAIVATMLRMVETRRVRLIAPTLPEVD